MSKRKKVKMPLAGCQTYKGKPLTGLWYAEQKMDGYRGAIIFDKGVGKAYTHNGCEVINAKYILRAMTKARIRNMVLDGEYLVQGNWNDTGSVVMTQTPHPLAKKLVFNVFDALTLDEWNKRKCVISLQRRKNRLMTMLLEFNKRTGTQAGTLAFVAYEELNNPAPAKIESVMRHLHKIGYEGCVIKDATSFYAFKKSKYWLKVKPNLDADLKIVGTTPGKNRFAKLGWIGALVLEGKIDGKKVRVKSSGMTDEMRAHLTKLDKKGKLVGHIAEIKHEGVTVNNAVRFPRFFRLRKDKE